MAEKSHIAQIKREKLERVLNFKDVIAVGYGDLGSSIYYALGLTAMYALGAAPLSLIIAGLVFACTALTYAEMASVTGEAGGSSTYSKMAFNDLISFVAGWALLLDFIVTIAISAFSVGPYLGYFVPLLKTPTGNVIFTVVLIAFLYFVNVNGVKHSTRMSWILTSLTVLTQVIIVVVGGIYLVDWGNLFEHMRIGISGSNWSPSWHDFWKGTAMAMVAYTGIESMAQLGSETKRAGKTVPRAMLVAMVLLVIMYIFISVVALSAVSPQVLSTTYLQDPIAGIVDKLPGGGKLLGPWVGILAASILLVAANAGLMGSSRLSFRMGEHYQLPRLFYKLHKIKKTPYIALLFFAVLAAIIVVASRGRLSFLADLYNFGAMLAFFAAHISLIILRIRKPDVKRPFTIPFNIRFGKGVKIPVTALLGALATLATWCLVVTTKPEGRYLGIIWIASGLVMYFTYRKKKEISPTANVEIQQVAIPNYESLKYDHILVPTRGGSATNTVQLACQLAKVNKSKITAVYIVEVPFTLSMNTPLFHHMMAAESALRRAEAIGREYGVEISLQIIRSRSVSLAVQRILEKESYDVLVLGAPSGKMLGHITEELIANAPCSVLVATSPE